MSFFSLMPFLTLKVFLILNLLMILLDRSLSFTVILPIYNLEAFISFKEFILHRQSSLDDDFSLRTLLLTYLQVYKKLKIYFLESLQFILMYRCILMNPLLFMLFIMILL